MHLARERMNFVELTPAIRRNLEGVLQQIVDLLDALDGDADFEPEPSDDDGDQDEPTLGAPEQGDLHLRLPWARGRQEDGQAEITACEFSISYGQAVASWSRGYSIPDDAEDPHDREQDESDREVTGCEWSPDDHNAPHDRGTHSGDDVEDDDREGRHPIIKRRMALTNRQR